VQHTIGLILDYDPIALCSALCKNTIGLIFANDPSTLGSGAEHQQNRLNFLDINPSNLGY